MLAQILSHSLYNNIGKIYHKNTKKSKTGCQAVQEIIETIMSLDLRYPFKDMQDVL